MVGAYLAKQAQGSGLNNSGTTSNGRGLTDILGGLFGSLFGKK